MGEATIEIGGPKGAQAMRYVATALLAVDPEGKAPTTAELAHGAEVGFGTIQAALRALDEAGIVSITTHGHQGSRLRHKDEAGLWRASGRAPLTGLIPLPQSREFAGLATALSVTAAASSLPLHLLFRQGARDRLQLLRDGQVGFTVTSRFALEQDGSAGLESRDLSPHSFYAPGSAVIIRPTRRRRNTPKVVPSDPSSPDHRSLTLAAFPDAELIDAVYLNIPELVAHGKVSAAVWHQTSMCPLELATQLVVEEFPSPLADDPDLHTAVLVWRADDLATATIINACLPVASLSSVQRDVVHGIAPQSY